MAMTKRVHVSFDSKFVASTEEVKMFTDNLIHVSRKILAGEKVDGLNFKLAQVALEEGIEAALELSLKSAYSRAIKEVMTDGDVTLGNIKVEVKRHG